MQSTNKVEMITAMPSLFEMSSSTVSALEIEEKAPSPTLFIEDFAEMLQNFDDKYDRAKENAFLSDLTFYELDKIFWALKDAQDNLPASQDEAAAVDEDNVDENMQRVCLQMFLLERNLKKRHVVDESITTASPENDEMDTTEAGNNAFQLELSPFEAPTDEEKDAEEKLDDNGKIESTEAGNDSILELSPFEAPTEEEKDAEEKFDDMILKENDLNEGKLGLAVTVDNFEIEQDVDPLNQETKDVDVKADPDEENVRVTPDVEATSKERETTPPTVTRIDSQDLGKKLINLSEHVTEDGYLEENDSGAAVDDDSNDVSFNHAHFLLILEFMPKKSHLLMQQRKL